MARARLSLITLLLLLPLLFFACSAKSTPSVSTSSSPTSGLPPSTIVPAGPAAGGSSFTDVGPSHPYYLQIVALADEGIIGGYGDGTFAPNDLVTRQQFAKMIVKALGLPVSLSDVYP